jgi:carboxypeptidase Q
MKKYILVIAALLIASNLQAQMESEKLDHNYDEIANRIIEAAMADTTAFESLSYMCDVFGPRLSGSDNLENALDWIVEEMKKDGLINVGREPVMVPHWVRGNESWTLIFPRTANMPMLGLGGSIATPKDGITAEVLVVKSLEELRERASEAKGKIVVYNYEWQGYGKGARFRVHGAKDAAQAGAVASMLRSVSPIGMQNPHGGMMLYADSIPKIPHAAITLEDAALLQRLQDRGITPKIRLYMEAETLPDRLSANVVGEIRGTEIPKEIVALGGHIDSWDAGTGAHDDGAGCIATWKAAKLLHDLGIKPKRTIRAVMWVNEENGVRGGKQYAIDHKDEPHHLMFEFDSGCFAPTKVGYKGPDSLLYYMEQFEHLFKRIGDIEVKKGAWGVDAGPMARQNNVPLMNIGTANDDYFWYHHGPSDTIDKIDRKDFNKCVATIALAIYIYSDI